MWSDVPWSELGPSWVENWKTSWGCLWYAIFFGDTSKVEANLWGCTWSISNFYEIQWVSDAQYDHVTSIQARLRSRRGWSFNSTRLYRRNSSTILAQSSNDPSDSTHRLRWSLCFKRGVPCEVGDCRATFGDRRGAKMGQQFGDSTMTSWSRTRQTRIDLIMIHLQLNQWQETRGAERVSPIT